MRLSEIQISSICRETLASFGDKSHVWLFGSRVDDTKRGGDIDLYIEPEIEQAADLVDAKLVFLMKVHEALGEQRVDVVLHPSSSSVTLPIYHIAKETGVRLI